MNHYMCNMGFSNPGVLRYNKNLFFVVVLFETSISIKLPEGCKTVNHIAAQPSELQDGSVMIFIFDSILFSILQRLTIYNMNGKVRGSSILLIGSSQEPEQKQHFLFKGHVQQLWNHCELSRTFKLGLGIQAPW